jgi:hypothetical protein
MTTLHEAVHNTANKLLDKPALVELCPWGEAGELEERLINCLYDLDYYKVGTVVQGTRYDDEKDENVPNLQATHMVHPLALKHFKQFGEEYVLLLEATQRLTQ